MTKSLLLYKELKDIILTFQFQFFTIAATVICVMYVILGVKDFDLRQNDYDAVTINNRNNIENINVYSQLRPVVSRAPNVLSIFCSGDSYNSLNYAEISPFDKKDDFYGGISSNSYINEMFNFDFNKIISILLSLLALMLSYKAISEEYENSTLKLLLSNNLPRWKIITAKIISYQMAITVSLILVFVSSLIILLFAKTVDFNVSILSRLVIIFIYYELYLFIFILIGCLCSILLRKSSISLLACLFFWLLLIIVIPTGASFVSKSLATTDVASAVNENIKEIEEDTNARIAEWKTRNPMPGQAYRFGHYETNDPKHEIIMRGVRDEYKEWSRRYYTFANSLYVDNNSRIYLYNRQADTAGLEQKRLAGKISRFSIFSLLQSSVENYTMTSYGDFENFRKYAQVYRAELTKYIDSKNGFSSIRWFTDDPPGYEPIVADIDKYSESSIWDDKRAQHKMFLAMYVHKNDADRKLNPKDMPEFVFYEASLSESFRNAYVTTSVFLILIGVLVFAVFIAFNNYSVV